MQNSFGQLEISGTALYGIDFSTSVTGVNNGSFLSSSTYARSSPNGGDIDSDGLVVENGSGATNFGGDKTGGQGTGADVTTAGIYGFDVDNSGTLNTALGFQASDALYTPGTITLKIQNTSGMTLQSLEVGYKVYAGFANATNRTSSFIFRLLRIILHTRPNTHSMKLTVQQIVLL